MNGDALLELQRIDSALAQIVHRRTRLPELTARNDVAAALSAQRASLADAQQRGAAAEATIERIEHDAADLTAKRTRLEAQLKTVIAPREAEALMHEIAALNARRSELDDVELEALDLQGEAEAQGGAIAAQIPGLAEALAAAQAALDTATAELDREQHDDEVARVTAAQRLTTEEIARYDHARAQFAGVAVAKLDGTRCDGCHLDISRGELDAIRALPADELGECPQCGRFLVR